MKCYRNYFSLPVMAVFLLMSSVSHAQLGVKKEVFTHADTLRGTNGPARKWWDATKYNLFVTFNITDSTIKGYNEISFKPIEKGNAMQIDLQKPMVLDSILVLTTGKKAIAKYYPKKNIKKDGDAYFIDVKKYDDKSNCLKVYYHGKPVVAKRPPWDGGLIWQKDKLNRPFVSVACQGLGASVWYPCKDIQSDEPDSAEMHITIPDSLICVGNGRFRGKKANSNKTATYNWAVTAPINNYNLIPYIGKYVHFNEVYEGEKGKLDMDYWVLDYELDKAKEQFKDAPRMMKAFEYWFGPYPFYEDGYKLVQAPHLGMEHQSAVAYGNGFNNGYLGRDLSGSGWGLKWDFIIVHESGHEWFANNITSKDLGDMWVHEGFTNYSETLFTDYYYGKQAATDYIVGVRKNIRNDQPIIGPYGVNKEGSGDMYYKAGNMLHTIRQVINNDSIFRGILRGLNSHYYHQTVTTQEIEKFISDSSHINFSKVFDQYLRTTQIPVLEYKIEGNSLSYRYTNSVDGFEMPLKIQFKGERWIEPNSEWQTLILYPGGNNEFKLDPNFYIKTKQVVD